MRTQLRHSAHGGSKILGLHRALRFLLGNVNRLGKRPFLILTIVRRIGATDILSPVLLLLDTDDVGCTLVAGEEILAIVAIEEFTQSLNAAHDEQEIILAFEREDSIDKVVPSALLAQLDLEAIGYEIANASGSPSVICRLYSVAEGTSRARPS